LKGFQIHTTWRRWGPLCLFFALEAMLIFGLTGTGFAQKQNNFWYFGKNAALDFNGFDPFPLANSKMDAPAGAASVSDSTGKLLFYTDGASIWNSSHQKINSSDMSGDPWSTQSATIVPDPDTVDQYFVFTTRRFDSTSPTNYGGNFYKIRIKSGETGTIIYDFAAATGRGGLWTGLSEKFLAIPFLRSDGKTGYWFLMHEFNSDNFVRIKYDGVLNDPEFPVVGSVHKNDTVDDGTNRGAAGQMKVNDLGTRIALAVEGGKYFELFRFNTNTGVIDRPVQIPAGDQGNKFGYNHEAYGVEFSPTGRYGYQPASQNYLYGTARDGVLYQWDLSYENDPFQLRKTGQILSNNPEMQFGALQIAPNDKIYVAFKGQDFIGVINAPMRPDCKFDANGARLINNETDLGGTSELGLPAKVPVIKGPEPFYFESLCLGSETLFYITDQLGITPNTPRAWAFTNLSTGKTVTKTSVNNDYTYLFPAAGNYRVTLTVFKSGSPVQYFRNLTINPLPVVQLVQGSVKDTVILCKGSYLDLDAGFGAFYEWEDVTIKERRRTVTTDENFYNFYRVKLTDYHGCVGWDTVITRREIPPTATHTTIRAFCSQKDGSATVIPNGNIANFTYRWEGYPSETSNTLSGINGGQYIVHVTRISTGCEVVDTIHVDELGGSSIKINHDRDTVCPGTPFTLKLEGAAEYEWVSPSGLTGSEVTVSIDETTVYVVDATSIDEGRTCVTRVTDTIRVFPRHKPDLGADLTSCQGWTVEVDGGEDYIDWNWSDGQSGRIARVKNNEDALVLYATDRNQCIFTDTIGVHFMPSPAVDLGKDLSVCSTDPVILSGGAGDSYLWNTGETTQTLFVSKSGDYSVMITKDGCSLSDTVHIQLNDPGKLKLDSVSFRDISCFGAANGSIRVFAKGDGLNFYYSIDDGLTYLDNGGIFENLEPGIGYRIKVLEDSVCQANYSQPITITQPDSLLVKFCTLPPSCRECTDGSITVATITGGTPPYVITLNEVIQDSVMLNLGIGNYSLKVTDAQLCTATYEVILADGMRPEIISSVNEPVCSGTPVTLRVTNSLMAEWILPDGRSDLEIVVYPLVTTTYRVKAINADADYFFCENLLEFTIEIIPFIPPELGEDITACDGDTVDLDGGDYIGWEWSNGMTGRNIRLTQTINPLYLTVLDSEGCFLRDTVYVGFSPHPAINLGQDQSLCTSDPVILSGGSGDSYLWNTGEVTQEITTTLSGQYSLVITRNGCSSADSVNITLLDPGLVLIDSVLTVNNACYGAATGSIEIFVHGSGTDYLYSIDDGVTYQGTGFFDHLSSADSYRIWILADSLCYKEYSSAVSIGQPDSILVTYRLKSPKCETCNDGKLTLDISGGTPPYQINLSGAPIGLITETLSLGHYTLEVTDAAMCVKTLEFTLELLNQVPNVITTNGDGVNDLWKIPMLRYYPDAIVRVFNGSGKLVFESQTGYPVPWDGRDNGNPLPLGTYYYLINLGQGEQQLTGYLTILR